jgi:hypothetical protein
VPSCRSTAGRHRGLRCREGSRAPRRCTSRAFVEQVVEHTHDFNLNLSRYVSTAMQELAIDLSATHKELVEIEKQIRESSAKHNAFLKELGLSPLPAPDK